MGGGRLGTPHAAFCHLLSWLPIMPLLSQPKREKMITLAVSVVECRQGGDLRSVERMSGREELLECVVATRTWHSMRARGHGRREEAGRRQTRATG